MVFNLVLYLLVGATAGFLGGLLGIGGGLLIVAALSFTLPALGVPASEVMHVSVATSLAGIVLIAAASTTAQLRRRAVMLPTLLRLAPGLVLGGFIGAHLAQLMSGSVLRWVIAGFCLFMAWRMAFGHRREGREEHVPTSTWLLPAGLGIGTVSAIVGIGGGSLTVPLLVTLGVQPVRAVATSSAAGLLIALASSISYMLALHAPTLPLPTGALGYVYLPAAAATAIASMITAQFGVRLAHRLSGPTLKRMFAAFLLVVGVLIASGG